MVDCVICRQLRHVTLKACALSLELIFVRYMPMIGPDLGSRELNEARMMEYWHGFVSD
jgi:hypothetical protein